MALEPSVVNIADLNTAWPSAADPKSNGDDHLRNLKTALKNAFAGFTGSVIVTGTDGGAANAYTLTPTQALPAYGARMIAVFAPTVANTGAATLSISGLPAKAVVSVSGAPLVLGDLAVGSVYSAFYDGTQFRLTSVTKNYVDQIVFNSALPAQALGFLRSDGVNAVFSKSHAGYAVDESKGADIASAATINLTTATGNLLHVTGTNSISAITIPVGAERTVIFDGVLTLTHGSALLLPGATNITTAAGDRMIVRGDAGGAAVVVYARANGLPIAYTPYLKVSDRKAANTGGGGTSISNDETQTRVLNTVEVNTIAGASLASNAVTLPAGTYDVRARAPALRVASHRASLYNVSDSAYALIGSHQYADSSTPTQTDATVIGRIAIGSSKTFSLRHYTNIGVNATGLGASMGVPTTLVEVYSELEFWKVA